MTLHPTVRELLAIRGITADGLELFLDPSLRRLVRAGDIPGVSEAAAVIVRFLAAGRKIVVFGDYDCDGVCATAIMVKAVRRLGGVCEAFIPDRFSEGYGMTRASIERMLNEHPDAAMVVTVDNGITSAAEVEMLKARGLAVVVTDHHLPPAILPECDALVDPKIPENREAAERIGCLDLCGAGLAFFLACELAAQATQAGLYDGGKFGAPLLVLAGIATVADIVPLTEQNRIIVANALKNMRAAPIGVRELFDRARRRCAETTSRDFGFVISPRINAAGRMGSAREAYDLLMADNREESRLLAQRVDCRNAERKTVENRMIEEAVAQIPDAPSAAAFACDSAGAGLSWHSGVCGIVAARLLDRYGVPAAVAVGRCGSVRAGDGCNAHVALSACAEFLERFGGHAAAGGFTVKEGCMTAFREAFERECARQLGESGAASGDRCFAEPEMWLEPEDLTKDLHDAILQLEPFGEGNPEPMFGLRRVALSDVRLMGERGRHASLTFSNRNIPRAVWWNHGAEADALRAKSSGRFDVSFKLDVSDWGGNAPSVELIVKSIRPS